MFLEVAKLQSFAAAAKALGMSGPAASKQVMALGEKLGVKLLHRTTRMVTLTDEGSLYYERARLAIDELKEAASAVQDMKATPKGLLRVNVPLSFGQTHRLPVISGFAKKYQDVVMDVSLEDRTVDIMAEGYDVVVRIGVMHDSNFVIKTLAPCPMFLVAAPGYMKHCGDLMSPQSLKNHRLISYAYHTGGMEWKFRDSNGRILSVKGSSVFKANTAEMMLQAALDGVGVALLPSFSCDTYIKAKRLVQLLPEFEGYPVREIAALMPPNRYRSTKVKLFVEWLANACKAMPFTN